MTRQDTADAATYDDHDARIHDHLTEEEREILEKVCERQERIVPYDVRRSITHSGNYTVCLLDEPRTSPFLFVGVAKRNPTDEENRRVGEVLAFRRAVDQMLKAAVGEESSWVDLSTMVERGDGMTKQDDQGMELTWDPQPIAGDDELICLANNYYQCTAKKNHPGLHTAHGVDDPLAVWKDDDGPYLHHNGELRHAPVSRERRPR